jgi:hypothetical protein
MATGPLGRSIDYTSLASSEALRAAASGEFAPRSRINALEAALRLVISARKVGTVPPLLADAIDIAERVLDISFPPSNARIGGVVDLSHRVPLIGGDPVEDRTGQ